MVFKTWIQSGIRYINGIINNDGLIDQTIILENIMYNGNWIAELSKLKTAIPKEWLEIIR